VEELLTELVVRGEPTRALCHTTVVHKGLVAHNGCTQHTKTEKSKQHGQLVALDCRLGVKAVAIASPTAAYTATLWSCACVLAEEMTSPLLKRVHVVVLVTVSWVGLCCGKVYNSTSGWHKGAGACALAPSMP
jgi:hypothetical protein